MSKELNFEQLQKKLKKVLDTNKFRFIFIFYPDINLREDIKNYISKNFTHSNSITLELENNTYQDISNVLYENDKSFIFIDDFFDILENTNLYNGFNQRRDKIASKNINLICFINSFNKDNFFKTAIEVIPDLLEFKNAIFEIEQIEKENKLEIKEISSSSYSSLGGLTTESKRKEVERLLLKLKDTRVNEQKINLLNQISTIHKDMGEFNESLKYLEKLLLLEEEVFENNSLDIATTYNNISIIYQAMGELKKALNYQEKSLKLKKEISGDNHPSLAVSYNNISMLYQAMGELKKALEYQEKSLKLTEKIFGDNHPDLARNYNNISSIYSDIGELKKALEYQEKSLKLTKKILGDNHPDLAGSYNNISTIYQDMGELKKALEYQKKSLSLTKEILGDKHPDLAINYNNMSMIYKDLKECKKVKEYIEKAINIWKDTGYHKKELFDAKNSLKDIDFNIKKEKKAKKNKKGKLCKDI